jgi:fermentation-respiration switch protein FrsA (DUF1100 family)
LSVRVANVRDVQDGEQRFEDVVDTLVGEQGVTPPGAGRGFGRSALRVDGRIFAMFVRGELVVKLPAARIDELIEAGAGRRFDANKGTPMKEWLSVDPAAALDWTAIAREALAHVR